MGPSVYLAGPEVFLPDARAIGNEKLAICRNHGLVGIFPLDDAASGETSPALIYANCLAGIGRADAVIANLTPFRGPSADVGTAFELGFAAALGKPVYGYTNEPGDLRARVGQDGLLVEDFGHFDNLMLAEALAATGGVVQAATTLADPARDLQAFTRCIERAATVLQPDEPARG